MKFYTFLCISFLLGATAKAFTENSTHIGLAYFSENSLGKITTVPSAAKGTLGSVSYPLLLKHDWRMGYSYFISPTLTYTLLSRSSPGDSAKTTVWQLMFPIGNNFDRQEWDWYVGPGIINRSIKGAGGTEVLSNGTSTSTFARGGRTVSAQNLTLTLGSSYKFGPSRVAFDLITEGTASSKRNYNLMLSYAYNIAGGF